MAGLLQSGPAAAALLASRAQITEVGLSLSENPKILKAFTDATGIRVNGKTNVFIDLVTFWIQNYKQYDLINNSSVHINGLYGQKTVRPVTLAEVPAWKGVTPLFRTPGAFGVNKKSGLPITNIYTPASLKSKKYDVLRMTPNWYGFDAFGYVQGKAKGDLTSYGAIFDPANRGKASLEKSPLTATMKVATYLQKSGQAKFQGTFSNLTKKDLAVVFDFLTELKNDGQFRLFWSDFGQLVDLISAGEVWVGDWWAAAVEAARQKGAKAVFVNNPKEGSNGWFHGASISPATKNLDAVLKYVNWWLRGGVAGATLGLQGYYSPRPDAVKKILDKQSTTKKGVSDWEYWYAGAMPKERPSLNSRLRNVADWSVFPTEFQEYNRLWTKLTS